MKYYEFIGDYRPDAYANKTNYVIAFAPGEKKGVVIARNKESFWEFGYTSESWNIKGKRDFNPFIKVTEEYIKRNYNEIRFYLIKTEVKQGQKWKDKVSTAEYIVARVTDDSYCLINLETGNRFYDPSQNIKDIFKNRGDKFELVED